MTSRKCPECGLVNFAESLSCKRCEADLGHAGEAKSMLVYGVALGVGLVLTGGQFMFQLMSYGSQLSKYFFVALGVVYGVAASSLIASSRARDWLLALSLSSFYLLYVGIALWSLLERNKDYGGRLCLKTLKLSLDRVSTVTR